MISNEEWQNFLKIENEYRQNHIPCVRKETAKLLSILVAEEKPQKILEIGTAVGYSGTIMLLSCESSNLTTIDLSAEMIRQAKQNFKKFGVEKRVTTICDDAKHFFENNKQNFDFVFLDGPKGQYEKYLPYIKKCLNIGGVLFCDDVLYFGMVIDDRLVVHKKITIVRNLREFLEMVCGDKDFESKVLQIEDGILVAKKVK